jgi:hypothetical protein
MNKWTHLLVGLALTAITVSVFILSLPRPL